MSALADTLEIWPGSWPDMQGEAMERLREGKNTLLHWHTKQESKCADICELYVMDWVEYEPYKSMKQIVVEFPEAVLL